MRLLSLTTALTAVAISCAAIAAPPAKTVTAKAAPAKGANTIVATVDGQPIRMSDVAAAAQGLPQQVQQQMPPDKLFPALVKQLVSGKAVQILARKQGLDKDPEIARQMQAAADQVLQSAALRRAVLPKVDEEAIKAAYDKEYAGKPGEPEVHARHILVDSEAKAKDIIAQLDKGGKFDELAKKNGDPKDPATQQGGDLGFFKKGDMLKEFSDVAFTLKPNEYTKTPVHTRYGWHVIQVLETRTSQPPTYDQVHDDIRQKLLQADAKAYIASAEAQVKVQEFNGDGTPVKPGAEPMLPPRPAGAPGAPPAAPPAK
jgi:peptidyl-prolyl cis-trans isomerase C